MAEGEAGLCLLLWPEALGKLSSRQPMRSSNNQRRPQHELRWSERPSCQTWSQRTDPGPLKIFSHFHRSEVWVPILGAVGASSHNNPSVLLLPVRERVTLWPKFLDTEGG